MSMPSSPSLNKISSDASLLSNIPNIKPKKRSKKRNSPKSRSTNKMPPINNPSPYYVPRDINQSTPYKNSPRRIKTLLPSYNTSSTKNLTLSNKTSELESRSIETNRIGTSNFTKVKFPGIFGETSSTSASKEHEELEDNDTPRDKMGMSPAKKTLQVLTSSPTKSMQLDTHGGFSQAVRDTPVEKSFSRDLISAKKYKSQPVGPFKKEKLKAQLPFMAKHQVLAHTENSQIEGTDTRSTGVEEDFTLPYLGATKHSLKANGSVQAYAANTSQGLVRNYNEDRVSIILNISKPAESTYQGVWPTCSFFAVYDGHGGEACADFLRDHLHQMIVRNSNFPVNPVAALRRGFAEAEAKFLEQAENSDYQVERSGSCALVLLVVDDMCYIANVGDSRAVLSCNRGKRVLDLSRDHKPSDEEEKARIIKNGGRVYQVQGTQPVKNGVGPFASSYNTVVMGPHRVFPGKLSVSRTFGDIEAKHPKYDGMPGVIIAEPEIKGFKITDESDFIILACDGIYDKLSSEDVVECVWNSTCVTLPGIHQQSAAGVEYIMRQSLLKKTTDNITVLMISLCGFAEAMAEKEAEANAIEYNQRKAISKQASLSTEPGLNSDYSSAEDRFDLHKRPVSLKVKGNELRRKKISTVDKSEERRVLTINPDSKAKKNSISFIRSNDQNTSLHSPGIVKLGKSIVLPRKKVL